MQTTRRLKLFTVRNRRRPSRFLALLAGMAMILSSTASAVEHPRDASEESAERKNPMVVIETSEGRIKVELFAEQAPISTENFLNYVREGFYDETIFHRVIPDFMIQGGGMTEDMRSKPTRPPIRNEADNGLENQRGTLAMARTAAPHSATSQFFINLTHNQFLDHGARDFGYAVFGRVAEGMEVVDRIAAVDTGSRGGHQNVPVSPILIKRAYVADDE